jgi:hypothetical protein
MAMSYTPMDAMPEAVSSISSNESFDAPEKIQSKLNGNLRSRLGLPNALVLTRLESHYFDGLYQIASKKKGQEQGTGLQEAVP